MIVKPPLGAYLNRGHWASRGLVGCWLMNEGGGKNFTDLFYGENGKGTLYNDTHWSGGKFGPSLKFDGDNDYCRIGATDDHPPFRLPEGAARTWSIWFMPTAWPSGIFHGIWEKTQKWRITLNSDGTLIADPNAAEASAACQTVLSALNKWYHVVFVVTSDDKLYLYLDGILVDSDDSGFTRPSGTSWCEFGRRDGLSTRCLTGLIDNAAIWNRALSASEIAELYRNPFCMFEYDEWPLFVAAMGGAEPVGIYVYDTDEYIGNIAS